MTNREPESLGDIARRHVPLIASGLLFAWATVRMLAVGGWNPTTALAIAQVSDTVAVLLGTAVSIGRLVAVGVLAFVLLRPGAAWNVRGESAVADFVLLTSGLVVFTLVPIVVVALLLVVALLVHVVRARVNAEGNTPPWQKADSIVRFPVVLAVVLGSLAMSSIVWLPREIVTFTTESAIPPAEGFVLDEDSHWLTILIIDDVRAVIRYDVDAIESRTVCQEEVAQWWMVPLATIGTRDDVPVCAATMPRSAG